MIALNLLSPEQKSALRSRIVYSMIERLMTAAVVAVAVSAVLLQVVRMGLERALAQVQARQLLSSQYVSVNDDVRKLNSSLGRIETLQKMAVSPSSLLQEVARLTPEGVAVTGLDVDVRAGTLRLLGIAARREDLLAYEAALRSSPFVTALDSPISNLFLKADISFELRITLNAETLKRAYEPAP